MRAHYFDVLQDAPRETDIADVLELRVLCDELAGQSSGRGHSTVELDDGRGASLSVSFEADRAMVVWIDAAGLGYSSLLGAFETGFVFDYMGSWSEAPARNVVPLDDALLSADRFIRTSDPRVMEFEFELDSTGNVGVEPVPPSPARAPRSRWSALVNAAVRSAARRRRRRG